MWLFRPVLKYDSREQKQPQHFIFNDYNTMTVGARNMVTRCGNISHKNEYLGTIQLLSTQEKYPHQKQNVRRRDICILQKK